MENPTTNELPGIELVYALACTADGRTWFAASGAGLKRSTDGGATWADAYASLDLEVPLPTTSVVVRQLESECCVIAGVAGGVLYSTDEGDTWVAVSIASPPPAVSTLCLSPDFENDEVVIAGTTQDGVFRSANGGRAWVRWNFGLLDMNVYCLGMSPDFADDETLFAGVESGMFRSTNAGRAWREVDLPFGYDPVLSIALSPDFARDGTLFAGTETQGLWKSTDRGKTWHQAGGDAPAGPVNALLLSPDYPATPDILVVLDESLLLSRDDGATWTSIVDADVSTVLAPQGLQANASVRIGLMTGEVISHKL